MENDGSLLSIGELARRTGLPVRTIRFWSDAGVLPPVTRTESGRRLYDAASADQAGLVATLRELGLGLADVRRVLAGQASIAEVAAAHRDALDAQIRVLQLHRAAMAVVVMRSASDEEKVMMSKLAEMPAAGRRQLIDDFLAEVFQGLEPSPARAQRWAAAWDLPDDPSPGQVEAWAELAGLVSDPDFRRRTRQVTEHGIQLQASGLEDLADWATQHAVAALLRGCPPDSAEAATVVNRILEPNGWSARREELLADLELLFEPRIERYWQLTAIINGLPPFPTYAPAFEWLIAALRADR
jgi:DNA-binding transcriptional MerR regulator